MMVGSSGRLGQGLLLKGTPADKATHLSGTGQAPSKEVRGIPVPVGMAHQLSGLFYLNFNVGILVIRTFLLFMLI